MNNSFFKFPATPHLAVLPGVEIRKDKVFTDEEREAFLQKYLTVEEKIDGANLGISFDAEGNLRAQNRGSYVEWPGIGQWRLLEQWLRSRINGLYEHLFEQFILFGEWCYATHSIHYNHLPDWFLGFDVFDKHTGRFLSSLRRDALLEEMEIARVPRISKGHVTLAALEKLLANSQYSEDAAEGLYLRYDDGDWLRTRAKLVRPEFVQSIEQHWAKGTVRTNQCVSS